MQVVLICIGLFLLVLGFLIWKSVMVGLIAGYDEKKTKDKQGLSKWVGSNLIIMGSLTILISLVTEVIKEIKSVHSLLAFIIIIIVFCIRIAIGSKRYE